MVSKIPSYVSGVKDGIFKRRQGKSHNRSHGEESGRYGVSKNRNGNVVDVQVEVGHRSDECGSGQELENLSPLYPDHGWLILSSNN
jgi:hypothetical protein